MLGDNGIYIKENIIMNKMLVVVDMQNDFIDGVLGSPEAQAIVPKVVERVKQAIDNDEIIFLTKDTHYQQDYLDTEEGKNLPIPHCIFGTKGWDINKDIYNETSKRYNNTFHLPKFTFGECWDKYIFTYYDEQEEKEVSLFFDIETKNIKEIEIIGLDTDFCVLANAMTLKAAFPNAHIVINAECCAGSIPEWHEKALDMLEHCHCEIINRK